MHWLIGLLWQMVWQNESELISLLVLDKMIRDASAVEVSCFAVKTRTSSWNCKVGKMEIGGKGFALSHDVIWIVLLLVWPIDSVWDGKANYFALNSNKPSSWYLCFFYDANMREVQQSNCFGGKLMKLGRNINVLIWCTKSTVCTRHHASISFDQAVLEYYFH